MAPPPDDDSATSSTDPTRNVLALVRAEGRRQDDLREMQDKRASAEARRLDDLRQMNDDHLRELINVRADGNRELIHVRAEYEEKLRLAAVQQATELAKQVTIVADTFREALTTELGSIRKDIAVLRENQSATGGRSAGLGAGWQYLVGGVGLLLTLLLIASTVVVIASR